MTYTPIARGFYMPQRSVEECLRLWPTVHYRAATRVHRDFADRIRHQAQRPGWIPSPAQVAFMRQLVDTYAYDDIALDPDLVLDMSEKTGWSRV